MSHKGSFSIVAPVPEGNKSGEVTGEMKKRREGKSPSGQWWVNDGKIFANVSFSFLAVLKER